MNLRLYKNRIKRLIFDILLKLKYYRLIIKLSMLYVNELGERRETSKAKILSIGRSIFNEDIDNIVKQSANIQYIQIDKSIFAKIFIQLCPELIYKHNEYYKYLELVIDKTNLNLYASIVKKLLKKLNINAIISANYNYSWQQPIYEACNELGIKRIILFKEGIAPLRRVNDSKDLAMRNMLLRFTNHNFNSELLLVYNQTVKKAFLESNIVNQNISTVKVSGIPRFDCYTKLREDIIEDTARVVFFSFSIISKTDFLKLNKVDSQHCIDHMNHFHLEVIKFAVNNPNIKLTIKTKSNPNFLKYIRNIIKANYTIWPQNIFITSSQPVYSLIKNSKYIIGFNSTTMLQALIANRTVISADFSKFGIFDIFHGDGSQVYKVQNELQILQIINDKSVEPNKYHDIKAFLEERVGPIDGNSSKRANHYIQELVDNR